MTENLAPLRDVEAAIDRLTLQERPADAPRPDSVAFRRILVGTDGSPHSDRALAWASAIARAYDGEVHLVTSLGPPAFDHGLSGHSAPVGGSISSWQTLMESERNAANEILLEAKKRLERDGVKATTEVLIGSVAPRIAQTAAERKSDLVIVGGDQVSGLERLILGSVTAGVRHQAPCSVLVARGDPPVRHVLLATDGSPYSRSAVATGVRLAHALGAEAEVLHVVPPPKHGAPHKGKEAYEEARDALSERDATRAAAKGDPNVYYNVAFGEPQDVILERADSEDIDLVVLGTRGLSGLRSRIAGSVSEPVSRNCPVSVLLYKEEKD